MSPLFEAAFAFVVTAEGGLSTDKADRGNWTGGVVGVGVCKGTRWGISARSYPTLDIANLTLDQARAIYHAGFWRPIGGDALPPPVGMVCFDQAVNQGVHSAVITLQQAVGVKADGWVGAETLNAASAKPAIDTVQEICARRACLYARGDMTTFGLGWMRRLFRVANAAQNTKVT